MLKSLVALSFLALAMPTLPTSAVLPVIDPATFVGKAAPSNLFEIQSSQLALLRTTTPTIVAFANKMIADHTDAALKLVPAAQQEGVIVPGGLDAPGNQDLVDLSKLKGTAFDAAYVAAQIKAHDQAVDLFKGYAAGGENGALKSLAAALLPTLEMHQQMIHAIAGR